MTKKIWTTPHMEIVTLEHDKDVLAFCHTASANGAANVQSAGCRTSAGSGTCP